MRVKISLGNSKQGRIPSVSLPPVVSCRACNLPCAGTCYAMRMYKQYSAVRESYDNNWAYLNNDFLGYFLDIIDFLDSDTSMGFRWHVSGDIPTLEYFGMMIAIAILYPSKRFLAFTKQYEIINEFCDLYGEKLPENLNIIFSSWQGLDMPNPYGFPVSVFHPIERVQDFEDIKQLGIDNAVACHGACNRCLVGGNGCYHTNKFHAYAVHFLEHGTGKANAYWRKQKVVNGTK